ncbi:gamma-glutamyl-gamma-aminobutyrate hydrolase family protein [Flavobacteriales bacterium]|nr:gamma-glutamyl-gamma-aminobutyrate hydrolase family protein [Flavobacteriales bacterium]
MIKIGVSACFFHPDLDRATFGPKTLSYIENDMAAYVARPGVLPILIPELPRAEKLSMIAEMDGLVLQGGSDLAPETYGEKPIGRWLGDGIRDEYELELTDLFRKEDKPVLGICRGFQIMNAFYDGTLFQDIETQRPNSNQHRNAVEYDRVHHGVRFEEGSFFEKLYADEKNPMVNSVHHQAVKELGKGLLPQAFAAEDGIIEAFIHESAEPGKVMGVQWHPEFFHTMGDKLIDPFKIIDTFLSFAKNNK